LLAGEDQERFDLDWETGPKEAVRDICFGDYAVALVNNLPETQAGLDLIKEVKQRCPGETILFLNNLLQSGLGESAKAEGASGYLTKEKLTPSNFRVNLIDAIEVNNGASDDPDNFNYKAWELARKNPHIIRTSGNDIHNIDKTGVAGIAFKYKIESSQHFVDALRAGDAYLIVDGKITDREGNVLE
jgi:hypothetical protein